MSHDKLLTISIAAYNVAPYLSKTLSSLIIDKNLDRLEVLIINDGSKDETSDIAEEFVKKYPQTFVLINKKNGGHGSTINAGIENATGKYFKVLDGDDWLDPQGLEKLLYKLDKTNADLVLTDRVNVYETRKEYVRYGGKVLKETELLFSSLRNPIEITLSAISVNTGLLKKSGYKCLENCFYEDLQFDSYAIAVSDSYIYCPIDLYQYRLGREGQSISPQNMQNNIHMSIKVAKAVDQFFCIHSKTLSYGQKLCIANRAVLIHTQVISTYMSFKTDKKYKKLLFDFISEIKSDEIKENIKKEKKYMKILFDFPKTYEIISKLYKLIKRVKRL